MPISSSHAQGTTFTNSNTKAQTSKLNLHTYIKLPMTELLSQVVQETLTKTRRHPDPNCLTGKTGPAVWHSFMSKGSARLYSETSKATQNLGNFKTDRDILCSGRSSKVPYTGYHVECIGKPRQTLLKIIIQVSSIQLWHESMSW